MTIWRVAAVMPVMVLLSCGEGSPQRIFKIVPGDYALSEVKFTKDECNYSVMPSPLRITMDNATGVAKVTNLAGLPGGVAGGNKIAMAGEETVDHTTKVISKDCKEQLKATVDVALTADDKFKATGTFTSTIAGGNACTEPNLGYPVPCESVVTFVATKVP